MAKQRGIAANEELPQTNHAIGKNYFLGIGINDYANFSKLLNARKDIEDVFLELSKNFAFDKANAEILTDTEATRNAILKKIKELRTKVQPEDRVLIYYSGHGFTEDELGYWIPVDAVKNEIGDYISNSEVRELIKVIHARHILLISDSCFSASLLVRDASRAVSGAFEDWDKHNSRWAFISGKGVVSDGKKGENSPFAKAILTQLRDMTDEAVNIVHLADSVITGVSFNYEQQAELSPLFGAGHEGGQFIFRKMQTEKSKEITAWQNALNQDNALAYFDFIEKYPNSIYKNDALEKMRLVEDKNDWNVAKRLGGLSDFLAYLHKRPNGSFVDLAKAEIEKLRNPTPATSYASASPSGSYSTPPIATNEPAEITTLKKWTEIMTRTWLFKAVAAFAAFFMLLVIYFIIFPEKAGETSVPSNNNTTITDTQNNQVEQNTTTLPQTKESVKGIDYQDVNDWNKANKSGEGVVEDYENYLSKRPNGAFATAAKERIAKLKTTNMPVVEKVKGKEYEEEIIAINKLMSEDYDYKKAAIRLEKMAKTYPNDARVKKMMAYCKKYL